MSVGEVAVGRRARDRPPPPSSFAAGGGELLRRTGSSPSAPRAACGSCGCRPARRAPPTATAAASSTATGAAGGGGTASEPELVSSIGTATSATSERDRREQQPAVAKVAVEVGEELGGLDVLHGDHLSRSVGRRASARRSRGRARRWPGAGAVAGRAARSGPGRPGRRRWSRAGWPRGAGSRRPGRRRGRSRRPSAGGRRRRRPSTSVPTMPSSSADEVGDLEEVAAEVEVVGHAPAARPDPTVAPIGRIAAAASVAGGGGRGRRTRRSRPPRRVAGRRSVSAGAGGGRRLAALGERDAAEVDLGALGERLRLLDQARRVVVARDRLAEHDQLVVVGVDSRPWPPRRTRRAAPARRRRPRASAICVVELARPRSRFGERTRNQNAAISADGEQREQDRAVARLHRATPGTRFAAVAAPRRPARRSSLAARSSRGVRRSVGPGAGGRRPRSRCGLGARAPPAPRRTPR